MRLEPLELDNQASSQMLCATRSSGLKVAGDRSRSVAQCCFGPAQRTPSYCGRFYGVDLGRVDLGTVGLTIRPTENPSAAFVWLRGNFVDGELFDTGLAVHC